MLHHPSSKSHIQRGHPLHPALHGDLFVGLYLIKQNTWKLAPFIAKDDISVLAHVYLWILTGYYLFLLIDFVPVQCLLQAVLEIYFGYEAE